MNLTATALQMCRDTVFSIVKEYRKSSGDVYQMGISAAASSRGCGSANYAYDHSVYKKEVLTWTHQEVVRLLLEERKYASYAELHRLV